jgi:hypothetical protein
MSESFRSDATPRRQIGTIHAARIAAGQWGVIGWDQLRACGIGETTVRRWRDAGRLHVIHRGVYALGHPSVPIEGRLVAAVIHAAPGAALSHRTAAWWWQLLPDVPGVIEVSSATKVGSVPGVIVHHVRRVELTRHRRFPVTTVARTLRDLASISSFSTIRFALANADYRGLLEVNEIKQQQLGRGRPGSALLRTALQSHVPELAYTHSDFERDFVPFCERFEIPIPQFNVRILGYPVDALWLPQRLIVELDGYGNHSSPGQIRRDRRKELTLRGGGLVVLRYTRELFGTEPAAVAQDIIRHLVSAA